MTKGCPQESKYGPDLWKYAKSLPDGAKLIAYANDLALLIAGKHRPEFTSANALLDRDSLWASQRILTFSAAKS